jgi:hypothetical protein
MGYTSQWAKRSFENVAEKNKFFEEIGSSLKPEQQDSLGSLSKDLTPKEILTKVKK